MPLDFRTLSRQIWALLAQRITTPEVRRCGARVDPSAFSDDEFPVWCPECDYLLRGLLSNRCPECGHGFDRGRLLVSQYVLDFDKTLRKRLTWWQRHGSWIYAIAILGGGGLLKGFGFGRLARFSVQLLLLALVLIYCTDASRLWQAKSERVRKALEPANGPDG